MVRRAISTAQLHNWGVFIMSFVAAMMSFESIVDLLACLTSFDASVEIRSSKSSTNEFKICIDKTDICKSGQMHFSNLCMLRE